MISVCFLVSMVLLPFVNEKLVLLYLDMNLNPSFAKNTEVFGPHKIVQTLSQTVRVQYGEILMMQKYRLGLSLIGIEKQPGCHN